MLADRGRGVEGISSLQCNRGRLCRLSRLVGTHTGRQDHCLAKVIVKCHYSEVQQQQQVGDGFRPETNPGAVYP